MSLNDIRVNVRYALVFNELPTTRLLHVITNTHFLKGKGSSYQPSLLFTLLIGTCARYQQTQGLKQTNVGRHRFPASTDVGLKSGCSVRESMDQTYFCKTSHDYSCWLERMHSVHAFHACFMFIQNAFMHSRRDFALRKRVTTSLTMSDTRKFIEKIFNKTKFQLIIGRSCHHHRIKRRIKNHS